MKIIYCWVGRGGRLAAARLLYIEGQVLMADYYMEQRTTREKEKEEKAKPWATHQDPPRS